MDWRMLLTSLGISLVLTAFGYLLVPTILALTGKKYEVKKLKKINIINCIVVWLLFRILQISLGDDPSSGAAVFLWGAVGHWILKKYCLKEAKSAPTVTPQPPVQTPPVRVCLSDENEVPRTYGTWNVRSSDVMLETSVELPKAAPVQPAPQPKPQPVRTTTPVYDQPVKYCSHCGQAIDSVTKKCNGCGKQYFKGISRKTVLTTMVIILFVVSFTGNIILCFKNIELYNALTEAQGDSAMVSSLQKSNSDLKKEINELKADIADLKAEKSELQSQVRDYASEIEFYDKFVVFVEDDGTNLYHNYDCYKFKAEGFWAFNINTAIDEGYTPCSLCCD